MNESLNIDDETVISEIKFKELTSPHSAAVGISLSAEAYCTLSGTCHTKMAPSEPTLTIVF